MSENGFRPQRVNDPNFPVPGRILPIFCRHADCSSVCMGFFDKIKASVGIGGAKIELLSSPIVTSGARLPVRAVVRGGKLAQILNCVELSLEVWPEDAPREEGKPAPGPAVVALGKMPGSEGKAIGVGAELLYEMGVDAPLCQELYQAAPERYAALVLSSDEDEETAWNREGPVPMTDSWESAKTYLLASADIPGAIDPSAKVRLHVIPEAAGTMARAGRMTEEQFSARLTELGAERIFVSSADDQWFAWWSRGDGRVVAYSPIQMVCSVRPDGVHRTYDNERIPVPSRFPKQASESAPVHAGEMDEAFALARKLVAEARPNAPAVLLPRPVGNAVAALTELHIVG
jgi:hypothetical protein